MPLSDYLRNSDCGSSDINYRARVSESETGKPADKQQLLRECLVQQSARTEEIRAEQFHNRVVAGSIGAAVLALIVILVIFRKPIRVALESVFVSLVVAVIKSLRKLSAYCKSIAHRVREEAGKTTDAP
ncbi:heme exporter protein D [Rhizobium pisi]